jgi:hypothetical protein
MPTVIALACASVAPAAPALTTIQDVLYKADGSRFNGVLIITWNDFESGDGDPIPTQGLTVNVYNGYLKVSLVPTTTASAGANYTVKYMSHGVYQFTETWAVPPSSTTLNVSNVRVTTGTVVGSGSTTTAANTVVAITDVTGLSAALAARPVEGPDYATGHAAVIDAAGLIEGATGNLTDCLHVDGTSGPCGAASGTWTVGFSDGETPSPTPDGVTTAFTLANVPSPTASLEFYRNGVLMKQNYDYTLSGTTVTFVAASIPQSGDLLTASYRYGTTTSSAVPQFSDSETPAPVPDGVTTTFSLMNVPSPPAGVELFRNGILMKQGEDYVVSGSTLTFYSASVPQAADLLTAFYRY